MGAVTGDGYTPQTDYKENARDSLVDLNVSDNTELWLMQFPIKLGIDFDGKEVALHLHHEGKLGTVEGSSGKEYDLVSFSSQEPDATVFASSSSESKMVGRISRLVSVVHYPDPEELKLKQKEKSMSLATTSSNMKSARSSMTTPSRSIGRRSMSKSAASTRSSREKSALSEELGEPSKTSKKRSTSRGEVSNLDSGHFSSGVTSSGSMGNSHHKKSKVKPRADFLSQCLV